MAWQEIDTAHAPGWAVVGTAQTAGWGGVDDGQVVALDGADVFGGAAFAEVAFAGTQETYTPVGGRWSVIEVQ